MLALSMTRHDDGVKHGSTSLLEHSLDYRIFAFIAQLRSLVTSRRSLIPATAQNQSSCCEVELTVARVVELDDTEDVTEDSKKRKLVAATSRRRNQRNHASGAMA